MGKTSNRHHVPEYSAMQNVQQYVAEWANMQNDTGIVSIRDAAKRMRVGKPLDDDQALEIAAMLEGVVLRLQWDRAKRKKGS